MRFALLLAVARCAAAAVPDLPVLTRANASLLTSPATLTLVLVGDVDAATSAAFADAAAATTRVFESGDESWVEDVGDGRKYAPFAVPRPLFATSAAGADGVLGDAALGPVAALIPRQLPGAYMGELTAEALAAFANRVWGDGFAAPLKSAGDAAAFIEAARRRGAIASLGAADAPDVNDWLATAKYTAQQQATLHGPPIEWALCYPVAADACGLVDGAPRAVRDAPSPVRGGDPDALDTSFDALKVRGRERPVLRAPVKGRALNDWAQALTIPPAFVLTEEWLPILQRSLCPVLVVACSSRVAMDPAAGSKKIGVPFFLSLRGR